ncbi:MAG: carboxy terminal-processing peptidase, partial [Verrucomicrobiae bacterium]|nr:carboxy terminal-processing peptidase [Verrucomicrobiae bacterium]
TEKSNARLAKDQEFAYIKEDIEETKRRIDENVVSINRSVREAESAELEAKRDQRKSERIERFAKVREAEKGLFTVYALTQDNVHDDKLTLRSDLSLEESSGMMMGNKKEEDPEAKALEYPHGFDPYKRETLSILIDFIGAETDGKPLTTTGAASSTAKN